ncbi:hypothetical protein ACFQGT_13605 [Natrialbaceae archaeon GCM10025810]|uniref:DUF7521 family protein n=1 Tax=Halovalidus salilacus TaxID=3075124 RepID=UPI0036076E53
MTPIAPALASAPAPAFALEATPAVVGTSVEVTTAVVALKAITLVLGGVITYFAYNAYRRTGARPIGALALGFGFVTLGALLAGLANQAFGLDVDVVLLIESSLTVVGFGIIVYSLYADW